MKVELKKLQTVARLSQETTCFVADIHVDGKKVGTAENDGHGGNTMVHITDRTVAASLAEYAKTQVPEDMREYKFLDATEWLIDSLVDAFANAKEAARVAKAIAKYDAKYRASCPARGTHAARFNVGDATRWIEFRGDEAKARAGVVAKYPNLTDWTVIA